MATISAEQRYQQLFEALYDLCEKQKWGDPFSFARSREIYIAGVLGHTIASTYSGADAFDEHGHTVEYKSTTQAKIQAAYNGISVQATWAQQKRYLIEDKIGKYVDHYVVRYEGGKIVEMWKIAAADVLRALLPKAEKVWRRRATGISRRGTRFADPRIAITLTNGDISRYGCRLL